MIGLLYTYADRGGRIEGRADYAEDAGVPVLWDSGAFTAHNRGETIDPEEHARWVLDRQERGSTARYLALDVLHDAPATLRNFRTQRALGADVEPTVHFGATKSDIAELLASSSGWLNIGGIAGMTRGDELRNATTFAARVALERPEGVRLHGLGAVHPSVAGAVPLDGVDSTYWLSPGRFGMLPLFDDRTQHWERFYVSPTRAKTTAKGWRKLHRRGRWLREAYGVSPRDILDLDRPGLESLAVRSYRRFAAWSERRHGRPIVAYLASAASVAENMIDDIAEGNASGRKETP